MIGSNLSSRALGGNAGPGDPENFINCKNYLAEPTNNETNAINVIFIGFVRINLLRGGSDEYRKIESFIVQDTLRGPSLSFRRSVLVNA